MSVQTVQGSATAQQTQSTPDLMAQAAQSTRNLGWLQDYTMSWQTLRSVAIRIASMQNQQTRKDEEAAMLLSELIGFATVKCDALEQSYVKAYSKHERLMVRLNEEISRD